MDFTELGKNTVTVDMDADRFKCQLSEYSLVQPQAVREYMSALPEYIKEKEEREAELKKQKKYNNFGSSSLEYEVQAKRAKEEGRCPPPRFDKILDKDAVSKALKAR